MVHPVDPSNTATSVAAAAPAFNIRRLVLFAFIGRAFHLRVYSPVSPPPDVTVIALHADQLCSVLEEGVLMKNGRGSDYAQLSCARLRAGRDGRVLTPSTACPAEWPIPSPRPADSIPPAGIHDARQRQCDLCHASGSSCATPRTSPRHGFSSTDYSAVTWATADPHRRADLYNTKLAEPGLYGTRLAQSASE